MNLAGIKLSRLDMSEENFTERLDKLLEWESVSNRQLEDTVADIILQVKVSGDSALLSYSNKFDRLECQGVDELIVGQDELKSAFDSIDDDVKKALQVAADRIKSFHSRQKSSSWQYEEKGVLLGQKVTPLDRVGIYVPGGLASYPSSVLMNAIPAQVAGVQNIVMVSPTPDNIRNPVVLAAAYLSGIDKVFCVGGAQAIAALAFGTESVPRVDKIVGPGNSYVATAKKQVFGQVGIDMIAGPSEILVVCDGKTNPDWIAMDLFSQAEHDVSAQSILISPDHVFLDDVQAAMDRLILNQKRGDIIRSSLTNRGAFIKIDRLDDAWELVNRIAPEHLELSVDNADQYLPKIRHAGAIFLGRNTPEALGDYCAGPNHVLPTSGTARFFSPLGVYDFEKRSSIINVGDDAVDELSGVASLLADKEGLQAHGDSARYRMKSK